MTDRLLISDKEKEAVLRLDGRQRYAYFIKRVADWEEAWGLWDDGWALACDDDGRTGFALWPVREYAEACARREWATYRPEQISLSDLLDELLTRLSDDGVVVAVFPTPDAQGVLVDPEELGTRLRAECQQYE